MKKDKEKVAEKAEWRMIAARDEWEWARETETATGTGTQTETEEA